MEVFKQAVLKEEVDCLLNHVHLTPILQASPVILGSQLSTSQSWGIKSVQRFLLHGLCHLNPHSQPSFKQSPASKMAANLQSFLLHGMLSLSVTARIECHMVVHSMHIHSSK